MARSSDEFVLAWSSLACQAEESGWQAIFLPSAGPVEIQAGLRSPGKEEAVLFYFPNARLMRGDRLPEGRGFSVDKIEALDGNGARLAITRKTDGNIELFTTMVCDLVGFIDSIAEDETESKLLQTLIRRVLTWQQFMSHRSGPLSSEDELGLVGELYFLRIFLSVPLPPIEILTSWVGPKDAPQDFLIGTGAIEVKATMSSSGFPVKIGNLEQLDDAVATPLFLAAVKFKATDDGETLSEIILSIETLLKDEPDSVNLLYERLMLAGYLESHERHYVRKFKPKEHFVFSVSERFPRLTLGSVPSGVTRAMYEINLDHAKDFLVEIDAALNKLGVTG